jgi:hypothetical protein
MNIHICLISKQLLPNYIPLLMLKPDHVCIVSTALMQNNGMTKRFIKMLKAKEISYETYTDMPSVNMPAIYDYALEVSSNLQENHPNATIILNITGGTKLMSQGFAEVMSDDARFIYTDTQHNKLEYIPAKQAPDTLAGVLTIPDYLMANGAYYHHALSEDAEWLATANNRKAVTKYIGQQAEALDSLLGVINYLANSALSEDGKTLEHPEQYLRESPRGIWKTTLQRYHDAALIHWNGNKTITFTSAENTRYLGGIWLEEYVYHIAADEKPDDVQSSVKISWEKSSSTHNELDVLLVHNNRMLVIECKTMRFGLQQQKDTDVLYKIDSLGDDLGGLYGKIWLVSAREPTKNMLDRAKDRHIDIISPLALKNLRQTIQQWMQS